MVLPAGGNPLSLNEINVEKGGGSGTQCDMQGLEGSGINQLSASKPNGFTPNSVDEWYSYNHTASTTSTTTTIAPTSMPTMSPSRSTRRPGSPCTTSSLTDVHTLAGNPL